MGGRRKREGTSVTRAANLLASILLCFPEVALLSLDARARVIKFTFYLASSVSPEMLASFRERFEESLQAYYSLRKRPAEVCTLTFHNLGFFTAAELQRDLQTLTQGEINLVIALFREEFGPSLVTEEDGGDFPAEEPFVQEELLTYVLENTKKGGSEERLVALRDEGRVLVFNK